MGVNFCSSRQCKGLASTAEMIEGSRFKVTAQSGVTEQLSFGQLFGHTVEEVPSNPTA